jgi:hypothetical protein
MKYIITLSMTLALSLSAMAQTGLTFRQCLTYGATGPWSQYSPPSDAYRSAQFTVPAGNVWKIEFAGSTGYGNGEVYLEINNVKVQRLFQNYTNFPVWAKPGDVINLWATNLPTQNALTYFFSILEFNNN